MMAVVTHVAELTHAIAQVARSGADYTANFFASPAETERWIASQTLSLLEEEQAVLILRHAAKFHRLYHVASGTAALSAALGVLCAKMPAVTIVTDLVGKRESLKAVVSAHVENQFAAYTRLVRMHRTMNSLEEEDVHIDPDVVYAGPDDVQRIQLFMNSQLDPLSEQIPDLAQLHFAVAKGTVLVMRHASELAGVLLHDTVGFTTTLRYWHVDARFRNQGIGARLIRTFFRLCKESRRILLWVIASNSSAISKYRHYGFQEDSLIDEILVRQTGLAQS